MKNMWYQHFSSLYVKTELNTRQCLSEEMRILFREQAQLIDIAADLH